MSTVCSSNCGTQTAPSNYYDLCAEVSRKSGGSIVIMQRCAYAFTDIADPAEWAQAKTDGNIILLPVGKWELPAPTVNNLEEATGCNRDIEQTREYQIPFTTPFAANDCSDFAFWDDLDSQKASWRVILKTCDDLFYVCDSYFDHLCRSAAHPVNEAAGLIFSFTVPPHELREGTSANIVQWANTMKIEKQGLLKAVSLPGVPAVL